MAIRDGRLRLVAQGACALVLAIASGAAAAPSVRAQDCTANISDAHGCTFSNLTVFVTASGVALAPAQVVLSTKDDVCSLSPPQLTFREQEVAFQGRSGSPQTIQATCPLPVLWGPEDMKVAQVSGQVHYGNAHLYCSGAEFAMGTATSLSVGVTDGSCQLRSSYGPDWE